LSCRHDHLCCICLLDSSCRSPQVRGLWSANTSRVSTDDSQMQIVDHPPGIGKAHAILKT
jgi:hypothetical protein